LFLISQENLDGMAKSLSVFCVLSVGAALSENLLKTMPARLYKDTDKKGNGVF
jgi:hypothetical protein